MEAAQKVAAAIPKGQLDKLARELRPLICGWRRITAAEAQPGTLPRLPGLCGAAMKRQRLSDDKRAEIVKRLAAGEPQRQIAAALRVSKTTVGRLSAVRTRGKNALREERLALRLRLADVAKHFRGGVSKQRIFEMEHTRVSEKTELQYQLALAKAQMARDMGYQYVKKLGDVLERQGRARQQAGIPHLPKSAAFLATCSREALGNFASARMGESSALFKEASELVSEAIQARSEAELAYWLMDYRQDLVTGQPAQDRLPSADKLPLPHEAKLLAEARTLAKDRG